MRVAKSLLVAVTLSVAAPSLAQVLYLGAGAGALWERRPQAFPTSEWRHTNRSAWVFFAAFPVDDDTQLRVARVELPRDVLLDGDQWRAALEGWTVGVDYLLPGVWGRALFGAGAGSYRLNLAGRNAPPGIEDTRFGWYLKVGEWFALNRWLSFAGEVSYHRTNHRGSPQLLVASGSLVVRF